MKHKLLVFLFFFLFVGTGVMNIHSQSLFLAIKGMDGSEKNVELSTLRKITFQDTNLKLNFISGTDESVLLSSVRKLVFTTSTGVNVLPDCEKMTVYPNPSSDYILLKNMPNGRNAISIYAITGTLVMNVSVKSSTLTLNISKLPVGLYFVKVNNQVAKFTKQ